MPRVGTVDENARSVLADLLNTLPPEHPDRRGVVRALEVLGDEGSPVRHPAADAAPSVEAFHQELANAPLGTARSLYAQHGVTPPPDRVAAFIVVLGQDVRDDDTDATVDALRMVRGVASVEPVITTSDTHIAQARARHDLGQRVMKAVAAVIHPGEVQP